MTVDEQIRAGWKVHGDEPQAAWQSCLVLAARCQTASHVAQVGSLAMHVSGEHLGRWSDGIALIDRLVQNALNDDNTRGSLARSRAVLRVCAGDQEGFEHDLALGVVGTCGDASARARVLALACSAAVQQGLTDQAAEWLAEAMQLGVSLDAVDPTRRTLAVTGNNVACFLEEMSERSLAQTELMVSCAQAARRHWAVAGDWNNVRIAEYRLARSMLQAGRSMEALCHGRAALGLVDEHDGDDGTRIFAWLAVALARHALGNLEQAKDAWSTAHAFWLAHGDSWAWAEADVQRVAQIVNANAPPA